MNTKKILSIAFTFVIALTTLSGCFNKTPDLEDRISENADQEYMYIGIIEPLELDAYQQGTHQIRTDNDEVIIIQSQNFDLNRYLEKRVSIKGFQAEIIGDEEPVLNIIEIEFEDGSTFDELLDYENRLYGFRFSYPSTWELAEIPGGISLTRNEYKWVSMKVFTDQSNLERFVNSKETESGTSVTIGAQESLRFIDGSSITMYVPNPPKKKVYKIAFNEEEHDTDTEKENFYNLLESFQPIYSTIRSGEKCGGKDDIKCEEGFRCELSSAEDDALGICVSLDAKDDELDCPFIPPPGDCGDYRVAEYNANSGCPSRYECVDDGDESIEEDLNVKGLISTIEKYQDQILDVDGAEIIQYELTESANLIAVTYKKEEKKYKTLYSFAPSADEFNFIEKAHFEEGEDRDWELISGNDIQATYNKTVIKPSLDEEDGGVREVSSDMRLYENQHKDFFLEYPKNWYYRSFGALSGTIWVTGFANKSLDSLSDAVITVKILEEEPDSDMYLVTKKRDTDTIYAIEGPEDMSDTIDAMADSIE